MRARDRDAAGRFIRLAAIVTNITELSRAPTYGGLIDANGRDD